MKRDRWLTQLVWVLIVACVPLALAYGLTGQLIKAGVTASLAAILYTTVIWDPPMVGEIDWDDAEGEGTE